MLPIAQVAANAGIQPDELELFGDSRAKIRLSILDRLKTRPDGKMVIVTAVTPTKAGEGKTTTSISLTMGLGKRNKKVVLCVREPSMGPVFGVKGGGTGGGKALVQPMEEINLLFNGDFPAVAAAHNLLAAAIDASIYNGNPLRIDIHSVMWPRTLDMNDRQLRFIVSGLGGKANGVPRETGFIITAASEVMAVLALASDLKDLKARLGRIVVASNLDGQPVTADDLKVTGTMTVILKDAIKPNLVQTMEGQPAIVHAGPFGNIAHGANSIIADRVALKTGRLRDHRGRVRQRPRIPEVLRHRLPLRRVCAERGGAGDDGAVDEAARRPPVQGPWPGGPRCREEGHRQPRAPTSPSSASTDLPCVVAINSFPTDTKAEIEL